MLDRPNKDFVRELMIGRAFCPSFFAIVDEDAEDIKKGLALGTFTKDTFIYGVQRNRTKAESFKSKLTELGITHYKVWCGELHDVPFLPQLSTMFFDFCGNTTAHDCLWMKRMLPSCLSNDGRIGITVSKESRANGFVNRLISNIYNKPEFQYVCKQFTMKRVRNMQLVPDLTFSSNEWPVMYALILATILPELPMTFRFIAYKDKSDMFWIEGIPGEGCLLYDDDPITAPLKETVREMLALWGHGS